MKTKKLHLAILAAILSGATGAVVASAEIEGAATMVTKPVPKDINVSQAALLPRAVISTRPWVAVYG